MNYPRNPFACLTGIIRILIFIVFIAVVGSLANSQWPRETTAAGAPIRAAHRVDHNLAVQARREASAFDQPASRKDDGSEGRSANVSLQDGSNPQKDRPEFEIYSKARTVIDLTRAELLQAYPAETKDLDFDEKSERLGSLLRLAGERVQAFFNAFPNTLSKEQVRMERLNPNGTLEESTTRNYLYSFSLDKTGAYWTETRTESDGRPVDMNLIREYFLTPGRAGITAFLHPIHQGGSRFRYLGRQSSPPNAYVIAFAQKPESGDYLGSYQSAAMIEPTLILYQGLVWVDPITYQIVRMRTELLAPRTDVGLARQTTEIWLSEVRLKSLPESFWLPREVVVTSVNQIRTYRNRLRYSDYQIFTVSVQEKIIPPQVKK